MKSVPTHSLPPAKKSLGQCFLVERHFAREIVHALSIQPGDTVLEIGPGRGMLTEELVETPARVIAIEIDQRLLDALKGRFASHANFELRHEDFLETDFEQILSSGTAKVVGNLPYHLAAEVIYKLLVHARATRANPAWPWIDSAVLMMQKEVAERIAASPGGKAWGKLSVFAQLEARTELMVTVPAAAFRPTPKVDGGVVRMQFYRIPPAQPLNYTVLERIVRYTFSHRRKMLKGTLSSLAGIHPFWQQSDLDFKRRPETLTPGEWVELADVIVKAQSAAERVER